MRSTSTRSRVHDRFSAVLAAAGAMTLLVGMAVMVTTGSAQANHSEGQTKWFVCKYVGTPGVDEELQTGDNPISVAAPAINHEDPSSVQVGDEFADAQGRSVVIAEDTGQPEPGVEDCPPVTSVDVCPNIGGDQQEGTDCEQPDDEVAPLEQTRQSCVGGVENRTGTQTTTYSFDDETDTWVPTVGPEDWGEWTKVRDLTEAERERLECDVIGGVDTEDVCPNIAGDQETVPAGLELDGRRCVEPAADDEPTVKGVEEELPTEVDAGLTGPDGPSAAGSPGLLGEGLAGGGLMLLLAAAWMRWGRLPRGAHQV